MLHVFQTQSIDFRIINLLHSNHPPSNTVPDAMELIISTTDVEDVLYRNTAEITVNFYLRIIHFMTVNISVLICYPFSYIVCQVYYVNCQIPSFAWNNTIIKTMNFGVMYFVINQQKTNGNLRKKACFIWHHLKKCFYFRVSVFIIFNLLFQFVFKYE